MSKLKTLNPKLGVQLGPKLMSDCFLLLQEVTGITSEMLECYPDFEVQGK